MKIVVLYSGLAEGARRDEEEGLEQAELVGQALTALGHTVLILPFYLDLENIARALRSQSPSLVFNLVESAGGSDRLIHLAPTLLDHLKIPYTGGNTEATFLSANKVLAKKILVAQGIATPRWHRPERKEPFAPGRYIIKSQWEHASLGLDRESVVAVREREELERLLAARRDQLGGDCFAEAFIEGREFNVSLLASREGPVVLPAAEMEFIGYPADRERIVDYGAKWDPSSWEYGATRRRFAFPPEDNNLLDRLRELSLSCWRIFGLRGYARVDYRVDHRGIPWILEINVNPSLATDGGFLAAAAEAGLDLPEVLREIIADPRGQVLNLDIGHGKGSRPHLRSKECQDSRPDPTLTYREEPAPSDLDWVGKIVESTDFFTREERDIALELVAERLAKGENSGYLFLFAEGPQGVVGYSCFGPIMGTVASYDLYWLAVHDRCRGVGIGKRLLALSEKAIARRGGKRIYADTASREQYAPTRAFYLACGYREEARLIDFYAPGDGKVIYVKALEISENPGVRSQESE